MQVHGPGKEPPHQADALGALAKKMNLEGESTLVNAAMGMLA